MTSVIFVVCYNCNAFSGINSEERVVWNNNMQHREDFKNMDFLAAFAMNEGEGSRMPLKFFFFKNVLFKKTFTIKTCFAVCT